MEKGNGLLAQASGVYGAGSLVVRRRLPGCAAQAPHLTGAGLKIVPVPAPAIWPYRHVRGISPGAGTRAKITPAPII